MDINNRNGIVVMHKKYLRYVYSLHDLGRVEDMNNAVGCVFLLSA